LGRTIWRRSSEGARSTAPWQRIISG
jgi:hypothetical protein